jgi:hypothetical protein
MFNMEQMGGIAIALAVSGSILGRVGDNLLTDTSGRALKNAFV